MFALGAIGMQCKIVQCLMRLSVLGAFFLVSCGGAMTSQTDRSSATYSPTPPHPHEVGPHLVGPTIYTIDARSHDVWLYFDFSRGAVVPVLDPKTDDWDLAFKRYVIRTNGGSTNPTGQGGVLSLGNHNLGTVSRVPEQATFVTDIHPINRPHSYSPVFEKWFNYSYLANVLAPKPVAYIVRTQDGKYAKIRLLSYYCTGNIAGCMTFEYVYQGDGSFNLTVPEA